MDRRPEDILEAAPDALAYAFGVPVASPHPFAGELVDSPLSVIALAAGKKVASSRPFESLSEARIRGMGTQDFSRALAEGTKILVTRRFDKTARHRAFCAEYEVNDFKPVSASEVDVDLLLPAVSEFGEVNSSVVTTCAGADPARLLNFAKNVVFSRRVLIDDELGIVRDVMARYGHSAARTEAAIVYAELEKNPVLGDGVPVFHDAVGNTVNLAFSHDGLGEAMSKMRTQATESGMKSDLEAKVLVVSANLELDAKLLVKDIGLDLAVVVSVDLPAGRWYLFADPADQPVVGVMKLRGAKNSVNVEQTKLPSEIDGFGVRVSADLGALILGRVGAIRGGV